MKKIIASSLVLFLLAACSKDKYETKPTIRVKDQSAEIVPLNVPFGVTLEFTDKEGDVSDSIIVVRQRLNKRGPVTLAYSLGIPVFPSATKGEFVLDFDYNNYLTLNIPALNIPGSNPVKKERDTLLLKFVARDHAGNKSDTASTQVIVLRD